MAFVIWIVCVRDEPWSGRSDATITSGSPSPSNSSSPHDEDGSASASPPSPPSSSLPQPAAVSARAPMRSARSARRIDFFLTCLLLLSCESTPALKERLNRDAQRSVTLSFGPPQLARFYGAAIMAAKPEPFKPRVANL